MGVISDPAVPKGDLIRRVTELEQQVKQLLTARRLEAASIGRGGLRLHSGGSLLVDDGGDIRVAGGRLEAVDGDGDGVFVVDSTEPSIFMRQELITQLSLAILADRLHSDSIPLSGGTVTDPGLSYIAADGPSLTDVEVSQTGTLLLLITARIQCQINQPTGVSAQGWMSYRITGATTVEPGDDEALAHEFSGPAADVIASTVQATRLVLVEGLNPGSHTIAARYRSQGVDAAPQTEVIFSSRNLTALPL